MLGLAAAVVAVLVALTGPACARLLPYLLLGVVLWSSCCSRASTRRSPAWSLALTIPLRPRRAGRTTRARRCTGWSTACTPGSPS